VTNYKRCEMWRLWSNRKYCPNPVFAWRNRGNPRKTPAKIAAPSVDVRMRDLRTRSKVLPWHAVCPGCMFCRVRENDTFQFCVSCFKIDETWFILRLIIFHNKGGEAAEMTVAQQGALFKATSVYVRCVLF